MEPVISTGSISFDCPYCNGKGIIKKLLGFKNKHVLSVKEEKE